MLLIPAIDLRSGRCVRLYQGDFGAETPYPHAPVELLQRYRHMGAGWVHVVDLDGAKDGSPANRALIAALARRQIVNLQVGGGIRSVEMIDDFLRMGVQRVVIGSAAIEQPDEVGRWLNHAGAERICLAFDVRLDGDGVPRVRTRGWLEDSAVSLWDALARYAPSSLKHVLCTDIQRDGALSGPNLQLYQQAVTRFPGLQWQASGGIRNAEDLAALAAIGVGAAISGKALLEDRINSEELRPYLHDASFRASMSAMARS